MNTRDVLLVDAFADEPLAGVPVAVLPNGADLSATQCRAIAGELSVASTVTPTEEGFRAVETGELEVPVSSAVAGATGLVERNVIETGSTALVVEGADSTREYPVDVETDRAVHVELPRLECDDDVPSSGELAAYLGVETDVLEDVGDDLPPGRVGGVGGTLVVPVTFLQHLLAVDPNQESLIDLFDATDAERLCLFTFDTLAAETDVHVRIFERDGANQLTERPVSGTVVGACSAYFATRNAFDPETSQVTYESGHVTDRPATLSCTLQSDPTVTGRALTVLDGAIAVPKDSDDDILVA